MRVLIDECLPRKLADEIPGHDVRTVPQMGWNGKKIGELLALMASDGFDVLVTIDQHVHEQNNLKKSNVGLIVLIAKSNRLEDVKPLAPSILDVLASIRPGDVVEVRG